MLAMKIGVKEINVKKAQTNLVFGDYQVFGQDKLRSAIDEFEGSVNISMASAPTLEFNRQNTDNAGMLMLVRSFLVSAT